MKKSIIIAILALFSFGDLLYSQDTFALQVISERAREKNRNNTWGSWSNWEYSNSIIYVDADFTTFYIEDGFNSSNDLSFVITYMSDSTYDSNGGELLTAKITEINSGNRGTLEWYTYPSGDRNRFTLKFQRVEIQYQTKDL